MHPILRELEPVKVWLKYMYQKWTVRKDQFFYAMLWHFDHRFRKYNIKFTKYMKFTKFTTLQKIQ